MQRRVVITGIGPVASIGIGKDAFFNSVLVMKTSICQISSRFEKNYKYKSQFHVPKPEFSLVDFGIYRGYEHIMEEATRLSVMCTYLALTDAGIKITKAENKCFCLENINDCIAVIGIGMSSLQTGFDSYTAHINDNSSHTTCPEEKAPPSDGTKTKKPIFNRMAIPMLMPNSASAWLSILFGIKGFNYTLNASCASGTIAIGEAFHHIKNGRCNMALAGGVESLGERNGAIMRGFDILLTLTKADDGKPRPFSKDRSGFLFNDGAGSVLVLEELESAKKRGANIYAEIVRYENQSEAFNIVQMEPSGKDVEGLIAKLSSGVKIDYMNSHGTGTTLNDEIEAKVIQNLFGDMDSQPYINSTKGIMGHSIGASGAIEAAVVAMSIKNSKIHGNLTSNVMENLNLPLTSIESDINFAISTSYGFGGHNAGILFKRFDEDE